jgi:hypothetical protein
MKPFPRPGLMAAFAALAGAAILAVVPTSHASAANPNSNPDGTVTFDYTVL